MEQPKSTGVMFESDDSVDLDALARAIEDAFQQPTFVTFAQDIPQPIEPDVISPEEIAELIPELEASATNHLYVSLEPMNNTEIAELIDIIVAQYSELGYVYSSGTLDGVLAVPPDGVIEHLSIAKKQGGTANIIRLG